MATSGNWGCENGQSGVRNGEVLKEKDSCGKCFSAVPEGIHEKALRWLELKVEQLRGEIQLELL